MTTVDYGPARLSAGLAIGAAGVAVAASGTPSAAPIGLVGVLLVGTGVVRGSRASVTLGALLAFGGVILGGLAGAPPESILVGIAAAVLAWDLGEQAINVGEQLGRAAPTRRSELAHAANSTLVAVAAIAVGYGLFLVAAGGQPVSALVVLLAAGLTLAAALRD